MPIGDKIKKYRKDKSLKQSELADLAKISRVTIGFYERGESQPTFDVAARIAQALEIPITQLLDNPYDIFKTPEFVIEDWLYALGYKVDWSSSEGDLRIIDVLNNLTYEITHEELTQLTENIKAYTKFQVQELLETCTKLKKESAAHAKKKAE